MNDEPIPNAFQQALSLHRAGRLAEAEKLYRRILQRAPGHPDALHMLGALAHETGHCEPAIRLIRQAIRRNGSAPAYHNSLGKVLLATDQPAKARQCFQRALEADRRFAPALFNLGRLHKQAGELDKAAQCFREATQMRPDFAQAWNNLGNVLQSMGERAESAACFEEAVRISPGLAEAHQNLASVRLAQGQTEQAMAGYERAFALRPDMAIAHHNLGKLLQREGRLAEAHERLQQAIRLQPKNAEILHDAATTLHMMGDYAGAAELYQSILKADPRHPLALYGLGQIHHHAQRRLDAAEKCYRRLVEADPDFAKGHLALAQLIQEEQPAQAIPRFEKVLALAPGMPLARFSLIRLRADLCDWRQRAADEEAIAGLVEEMAGEGLGANPLPPFQLNNFALPPALHLKAAQYYSRHIELLTADVRKRCAFAYPEKAGGRLKIGYLSPDFRGHVVGRLIRDLFRRHDRGQFEIFGYSLVDHRDEVRRDIESGCDRFIDVSQLTPEAAARRIHADGIHVLIDLGGYSTHTRPEIPALRPAPVQAHYLGYLDTMGAAFMPYVITDAVCLPPELASAFSEKAVHLPGCFVASTSQPVSDRPMTREEFGLPPEAFVFCCFNYPTKICPEAFAVWMRILRRAQRSVLWLYDRGVEEIGQNLRREAEAAGVDPARLVFGQNLPPAEYLARYGLADLFLDTFVYNAGGTAIGALQTGLPVLTCPGATYLSRMGASIVSAAGLPEMVCDSAATYERRAIELAADQTQLGDLRARLRESLRESPLFDMDRFARSLEEAYRRMWEQYASGAGPTEIRVSV